MKKQTAVEWLKEMLIDNKYLSKDAEHLFEEALAMEKEQNIKFTQRCLDKALDLDVRTAYSQVEQYYNETYEK
jgi:hypothetical protein